MLLPTGAIVRDRPKKASACASKRSGRSSITRWSTATFSNRQRTADDRIGAIPCQDSLPMNLIRQMTYFQLLMKLKYKI